MPHSIGRAVIATPYGEMTALGDDRMLYLLQFSDRPLLEKQIERLTQRASFQVVCQKTAMLHMITQELAAYYAGTLQEFKTPIMLFGTEFQIRVWQALQTIAFGKTCSYRDIAQRLQMGKGYRAVAQAANANPLAIIVPCHRMINANGTLGGYACGKERKHLLFDAERTQIFL